MGVPWWHVCQCLPQHLDYRQGSHITATFTEVLTEPLADQLVPLIEANPGRRTP